MNERILDEENLNQLSETKLKNQLNKLSWWLRFGSFILIPLGVLCFLSTLVNGTEVIFYGRLEIAMIFLLLLFSIGIIYLGRYARNTALANDGYRQQETQQSHLMMAQNMTKLWRLFAWIIIPITIILNGAMFVTVYDDYNRGLMPYEQYIEDPDEAAEFLETLEPVEEPPFPDQ